MMNVRPGITRKRRISSARPAFLILLMVLTTSFYSSLLALDCDPVSMALSTQAEIESFQDTYGPCNRVLSLYVEGDDISNLDGLSGLTDVGSSLYIQNNPQLGNITGLSNLTHVGRNLWIQNNDGLTGLDGLTALTTVDHLLAIFENDVLTHMDGLAALKVVGGSLVIRDNAFLSNLNGLSALTSVAGAENADQRFLHIENNPSLTNLYGLSAVTNLGIRGIGWTVLLIKRNQALSQCNGIWRLIDQWDDAEPGPGGSLLPDVAGDVIISDNLPACNSIEEILAQVDTSRINVGLNDAWYNPETDGQGFFINVFPMLNVVSLAWFTYDTELPAVGAWANLGDPGHRWFTAVGPIVGNQVLMDIEMTSAGLFDTATEIQRTNPPGSDGTILLTFSSCNSGTVEYDITSINGHGTVPIQRVVDDNITLCELLISD